MDIFKFFYPGKTSSLILQSKFRIHVLPASFVDLLFQSNFTENSSDLKGKETTSNAFLSLIRLETLLDNETRQSVFLTISLAA